MAHRLLLVQDDVAAAHCILDALANCKDEIFQFEWVRRCSEGIERLAGIEAILVDLRLPDSRGIETFDRMFLAAPQIPILILCNPQEEETAKLAVRGGAQDYLVTFRLDPHLLTKAVCSMIERAANLERLLEEKERAQVAIDSIGDAIISTDLSGEVIYLNAAAERLTGWSKADATGQSYQDVFQVIEAATRKVAINPITVALRDSQAVSLIANRLLIRRDGAETPIEHSASPIYDQHGQVSGAVTVFQTMRASQATTLKMSYLAQRDSLTDLPNRVLLNDRLTEAVTLCGRHQRQLAVLFLGLDRFAHINTLLGDAVGDLLLQSVSQRLLTCVRGSDTVARDCRDQFVVLLWEIRRSHDSAVVARKILAALRAPHQIKQHELHITSSIGIVTYPADGSDAETLLRRAELAMNYAKNMGRDRYHFFTSTMNLQATERQLLEASLREAIEKQELSLHYQPKFDLITGAIIGVEALIRWRNLQSGLVPPGLFISIAEDCGLIVSIGRWVRREACRQAKAWHLAGLQPIRIAINISPVELRDPKFASELRATLAESGLAAHNVELELPETVLLEDSRTIADVLRELKDIGVLLALDDFGTGSSNLGQVKRFAFDTLKIDPSLVCDLTSDSDAAGVVNAVIALGKSMHMQVVAEGVETRQQLEMLQQRGCPQAQGFYLGRPVPADEFGRLARRGDPAMAAA